MARINDRLCHFQAISPSHINNKTQSIYKTFNFDVRLLLPKLNINHWLNFFLSLSHISDVFLLFRNYYFNWFSLSEERRFWSVHFTFSDVNTHIFDGFFSLLLFNILAIKAISYHQMCVLIRYSPHGEKISGILKHHWIIKQSNNQFEFNLFNCY